MYIKESAITFDNGFSISFEDTFDKWASEIKEERELDVDNESRYITFESDEMVKGYLEDTTLFFEVEENNKLGVIELVFDIYAYTGKSFDSYSEFADANKQLFNELKEYLLEQFKDETIFGSGDNGLSIGAGNLVLGLNTGRGFEHVKIDIYSADNPLLEYD